MKYLMFLVLTCFLTLGEFFMTNGDAGFAYTALLGAVAAAILMINSIVEDRARKIVAAKELK